jgi:hypothetical protein
MKEVSGVIGIAKRSTNPVLDSACLAWTRSDGGVEMVLPEKPRVMLRIYNH